MTVAERKQIRATRSTDAGRMSRGWRMRRRWKKQAAQEVDEGWAWAELRPAAVFPPRGVAGPESDRQTASLQQRQYQPYPR